MPEEYFYGVTLSATHQSETWDPEAQEDYPRAVGNKLLIRTILLGPDAKPDELNVIQVETMSMQNAIKIPVAVLKVGENRQARLDIEFPDAPVTFSLIQGSGPVHVIGQHLLGALMGGMEEFEDMEEMVDELEEEEGDDFQEDENKRKAPAGKRKQNEDEDDEEGEPKGKKSKISNNAKGKAASPKKNAKK